MKNRASRQPGTMLTASWTARDLQQGGLWPAPGAGVQAPRVGVLPWLPGGSGLQFLVIWGWLSLHKAWVPRTDRGLATYGPWDLGPQFVNTAFLEHGHTLRSGPGHRVMLPTLS